MTLKAKIFTIASAILLSSPAWGFGFGSSLTPNLLPQSVHPADGSSDDPPPVLKPIRKAKVDIVMLKTWAEKQSDGSFLVATEQICKVTESVPVYEVKYNQGWVTTYPSIKPQCYTDLKIGHVGITFYGAIYLEDGFPDLFDPSTTFNLKSFESGFYVTSDDYTWERQGGSAESSVYDQKQKYLMTSLSSQNLTPNNSGDKQFDENIRMVVKYTDDAQ